MKQSPKEKAIELVDKYYHQIDLIALAEKEVAYKAAKQCAIIAVNEIINATFKKSTWDTWGIISQDESTTEYYQEVLKEIQNIK